MSWNTAVNGNVLYPQKWNVSLGLKIDILASTKAMVALTVDVAYQWARGCSLNVGCCGAQRLINVRVEAENPLAHPIWLNCSVCAPTDPVVFVYIVMSADIILRIFLEAKPLPPPSGLGFLLRSEGLPEGGKTEPQCPPTPMRYLHLGLVWSSVWLS